MRKLVYWYARCELDSDCYSIRTRTKREAVSEKSRRGAKDYGPIVKVSVEYSDAFDLMSQFNGEGRNSDEASAHYAVTVPHA